MRQDMVWTHFWDMSSGGRQKGDVNHIFIEAPEYDARSVFYTVMGRSPDRVTCTCCGEDYSTQQYDTEEDFASVIEFFFADHWFTDEDPGDDMGFLFERDIEPYQRTADVPREGYVWMGGAA